MVPYESLAGCVIRYQSLASDPQIAAQRVRRWFGVEPAIHSTLDDKSIHVTRVDLAAEPRVTLEQAHAHLLAAPLCLLLDAKGAGETANPATYDDYLHRLTLRQAISTCPNSRTVMPHLPPVRNGRAAKPNLDTDIARRKGVFWAKHAITGVSSAG
jgi:hypothetical protein